MECPICYKIMDKSCIGSGCTHHFCYTCIKKWKDIGKNTCPICKSSLNQIFFDKEFDNLQLEIDLLKKNQSVLTNKKNEKNEKFTIIEIKIFKNDKIPFRLIVNRSNFFGYIYPGLKVQNINTKSLVFENGLKNGNIIISVNNELCVNPKETIDYINECKNKELPIELKILRP